MIVVKELLNLLKKNKINFFAGVPDSVLKNLLNNFNNQNKYKHVIAVKKGDSCKNVHPQEHLRLNSDVHKSKQMHPLC